MPESPFSAHFHNHNYYSNKRRPEERKEQQKFNGIQQSDSENHKSRYFERQVVLKPQNGPKRNLRTLQNYDEFGLLPDEIR